MIKQLTWHNRFYLSRVFLAPDDGASTGAAAGVTTAQIASNGVTATATPAINYGATSTTTTAEIDYKALYEAEKAERAKIKNALDKSNSENAEYKRKERDRMTQEEQAAADAKARDEELAQLRQEITESKVEKIFASKGVDETAYKDLMSAYVPFLTREQSISLSEKVVALLTKAQAVAQEQKNNQSIVKGVVYPGSETSKENASDAKARVARMLGNQDNKALEEQKNIYKL